MLQASGMSAFGQPFLNSDFGSALAHNHRAARRLSMLIIERTRTSCATSGWPAPLMSEDARQEIEAVYIGMIAENDHSSQRDINPPVIFSNTQGSATNADVVPQK